MSALYPESSVPRLAPRRWPALAFYAAFLVAAFAAGWGFSLWSSQRDSGFAAATRAASLGASHLAQIKSTLAHLLKAEQHPPHDGKLLDLIAGLDAASVKAVLKEITANPGSDLAGARDELVERWAELDPRSALSWSQTLHDPNSKKDTAALVLDVWLDKNPAEALAALRALPLGLQTYNPWPNNQPDNLYTHFFNTWAQSDPAAAATAALNLPSSAARDQSLDSVAFAWAARDPAAALAWVGTLPAGSAHDNALRDSLAAMSFQDPQGAAAYALSLPNTQNRDDIMIGIAGRWAWQDPLSALAWANTSLTGDARNRALSHAFIAYSHSDPAAAAAYLAQLPGDFPRFDVNTWGLAYSWSLKDSQAALTWALALPTGDAAASNPASAVRSETLGIVLGSWSGNDPAAAAAYASNLTSDPDFGKMASDITRRWNDVDPQAALTWAQSLPAGDARTASMVSALSALAKLDAQTALSDAQQMPDADRDKAVSSVIGTWATQQPDQAAAALASLPAGENLDSATASVAEAWLNQDPTAASQWINTLAPGSARDGAVTTLIDTVGKNDPAAAYNWALTIGDQNTRDSQVVNLAQKWAAKDSAAAATAAQTALALPGLTSDQRASLQKIATLPPAP